jgi:hypothetical protein
MLGRAMLDRWARAQGLTLTSVESCWFFKGPFFFATRGQDVFRITARDAGGIVRTGYARCGGYWFGTWSEQVEVRWDA